MRDARDAREELRQEKRKDKDKSTERNAMGRRLRIDLEPAGEDKGSQQTNGKDKEIEHPKQNVGVRATAKQPRPKWPVMPIISRSHLEKVDPRQVGGGSFGKCTREVYRGNIPVIVKRFHTGVKREEVKPEAAVMYSLQAQEHHPCLPYFIGLNVTVKPYLIVSQFFGKADERYTLSKTVSSQLFASVSEWASAFQSLAGGLTFIHEQNWLHNDLKQNNVVCHFAQNKWNVVIIDFGKACTVKSASKLEKPKKSSKFSWLAPEVVSSSHPPSPASDVFSLGYVIKYVLDKIGKLQGHGKLASHFNEIALIASECLLCNPSKRPTTRAVAKSLANSISCARKAKK